MFSFDDSNKKKTFYINVHNSFIPCSSSCGHIQEALYSRATLVL